MKYIKETVTPSTNSTSPWLRTAPLIVLLSLLGFNLTAHAANGTWTNAPVNATWANLANWAGSIPGTNNSIVNNSFDNSVATFNSPIVSGIGGAGNPIITDDSTLIASSVGSVQLSKARMLGSIIFDTANCGAYVIANPSPFVYGDSNTVETGVVNLSGVVNTSLTPPGVRINAPVASSQRISARILIRLPSSTNGRYDLSNDSTDTNAVLVIDALGNTSATSRPLTLVLAGSNTGTNTLASIFNPGFAVGALHLVKQGTGRWFLGTNAMDQRTSGGDNVPANIAVNQGTLVVTDPVSFGTITPANIFVQSNGVLQIDGITLNQAGMSLRNGGTIRMNGSAKLNGVTAAATAGMSATIATTSSGDVFTVGNAVNSVTGGAADTVLHVAGPGTVLITNTANYIGKWSLDAGTTQVGIAGAFGTGLLLNVGPGATLDFTPLGAVSYAPSPSSIGGSGTGTTVGSTAATIKGDVGGVVNITGKGISLTYAPTAFNGDTTHPALYISQGTLSMGNNSFTINNASGTPLGIGTYLIMQQASGSITSSGGFVADVQGSGTADGTLGTVQVSGGDVNLVVAAYTAKNLVWKGGNPNSNWDNSATTNWLDGITPAVFNVSDKVAFDATGAANPTVNLISTLSPGSLTVDTTVANYTFAGSGRIAGNTGLTKIGTGTLLIQTANSYKGGTIISNGTVRVGIQDALPGALTAGTLTMSSSATLDLNGFTNNIGDLQGSGTVDNQVATNSMLIVGNNNVSGLFSGVVKNTSGTLSFTKVGTGFQGIIGANTYTGPTVINNGTLRLGVPTALSAGSSALTINGGILDIATDLYVPSLAGNAGSFIANNSTSTTNILIFTNSAANYTGAIINGSGGGAIGVNIASGVTVQFNGPNTYSGDTILGAGSSLLIGVINGSSSGSAGTGMIVASNNATIWGNSAVSQSSQVGNNVTTVSGGLVHLIGAGSGANGFNGLFNGDATTTNVFHGQLSLGDSGPIQQFSNFLGTVIFVPSTNGIGNRIFNNTAAFVGGGDNTKFDFQGGFLFSRNATAYSLGAISGGQSGGGIAGPSTGPATFLIGSKGIDSEFFGTIGGNNNIIKRGGGSLVLHAGFTTNIVDTSGFGDYVTNVVATNLVSYIGFTTVSNGVLKLTAPNVLTNSPALTLATATAVLDVSEMGYVLDQIDSGTLMVTNQVLITNGVMHVVSGQSLAGVGTVRGTVVADSGSTLRLGLPLGTLTVTTNIQLAGAVNMSINPITAPYNSKLVSPAIAVVASATLNVTNLGPEAPGTFQLFNHPVNFMGGVTLPTLTGTNSWVNNLTVDGSITLIAPAFVSTNSVSINSSFGGGVLNLSWPPDHLGWKLQSQTNSVGAGIGTNWVDVAGSQAGTNATITLDPANATVFFRLIYITP